MNARANRLNAVLNDLAMHVPIAGAERFLLVKSSARKLLWAALILGATAFVGFHVFERIKYYMEIDSRFTVRFRERRELSRPATLIVRFKSPCSDVDFEETWQSTFRARHGRAASRHARERFGCCFHYINYNQSTVGVYEYTYRSRACQTAHMWFHASHDNKAEQLLFHKDMLEALSEYNEHFIVLERQKTTHLRRNCVLQDERLPHFAYYRAFQKSRASPPPSR